MLLGGASAIAAIAAGFMLEKLFFEQWPWWVWAAIAILAGLIALFVSSLLPKLAQRQLDLPAEFEFRLQRTKAILSFLDGNMMWFYMILVIGVPSIIRACDNTSPPEQITVQESQIDEE